MPIFVDSVLTALIILALISTTYVGVVLGRDLLCVKDWTEDHELLD